MKKLYLSILFLLAGVGSVFSQDVEQAVRERLQAFFQTYIPVNVNIGTCRLDSVLIDFHRKTIRIYADNTFSYQPFRPETVNRIYRDIKEILPGPVTYFDITVFTDGHSINELIPNTYRNGKKDKSRLFTDIHYKDAPWVTRTSRPFEITRGLEGRHIALWQSHGKYYINNKDKWGWQRPRLFCTSEDQFIQSFILPYLIPMLENAGANVFTPRERDTQKQEIIVDNDDNRNTTNSLYLEVKSRKAQWEKTALPGFAQQKRIYTEGENPFHDGTARFAQTEKKKNKAFAEWVPDIPETGEYAVYVSYQSLPNSVSDAKYLVFHNGGVTEFKVNQKIGGGTWVYLGTFEFDKGNNDYGMVVLSNESSEHGVVCADAVRFGGGMGNISRGGKISGLPRYLEGARYSSQWAGMPYDVYAGRKGENDYTDDINTRSNTINYLSGGSVYNPGQAGLGVPLEMTMALHSDAGCSKDNEIIGSLGIYTTDFNNGKLNSGMDRYASRDLADILLTQIQKDIRTNYNLPWTRRSMWNRNYSETRLPATPSTIIELLSHQNFADMQLGHNPNFKFTVGRAIYKGILQYISSQYELPYVVQPLPVESLAAEFAADGKVAVSWSPVMDSLETTAAPTGYVVYTRIDDGGFDNGRYTDKPYLLSEQEPGRIYSYKVTAVNEGGESFPSEVVAACRIPGGKGNVLVVNGFDRISAPLSMRRDSLAGFYTELDGGVPDKQDISFIGGQQVFDLAMAGCEVDSIALGACNCDYETEVIGGNTFDYPYVHGRSIARAGYSFCSASVRAVGDRGVSLEEYSAVDLILGKQRSVTIGRGVAGYAFKTFSPELQDVLRRYMAGDGALFVSGSYVATDLWTGGEATPADRAFAEEVLHYTYDGDQAADRNRVRVVTSHAGFSRDEYRYVDDFRPDRYRVERVDALRPAGGGAFPVMRYVDNNRCAGVACADSRTFVMGFPFEALESDVQRDRLMADILGFLLGGKSGGDD